jgi:N4-gp56 family major capsid protein
MAKSSYGTSANETRKVWSEIVYKETRIESYWDRFSGTDQNSALYEETHLTKDKGDLVRLPVIMRLSGAGVTEGQQLEGNEEKLTTYTVDVTLGQYRHGVRDDGAMSRQRTQFDLSKNSKEALKVWGSEKQDKLCFDALQVGTGTTSNPSRVFYINSSNAWTKGSVWGNNGSMNATNSKLSLDMITMLKKVAETGQSDRSYVPVRPIKIKGKAHYVLVTHPYALADLRMSSEFKQAQRDAATRGDENPLFTGAEAIWDNVIIHAHEGVKITGASNLARGVLFGAQALVRAWGKREELVERDFDYGNEQGIAWGMITGVKAPVFNSKEFGSVHFESYATNIA